MGPSLNLPVPRHRHLTWLALLGLAALLLGGCAQRDPRPTAAPADTLLSDARSRQLVGEWQRQLADYIARAGDGDPAVLARLPERRATGTLRASRINFGALDLDASAAERDGFDVQGLLLAPLPDGADSPYVFVVGIVQRQGYRPVDIVDIRLVALSDRAGQLEWTLGDADPQALARYRSALNRNLPLRFPADQDRFELRRCASSLCADERSSAARWSLAPGTPAP